MFRALDSGFRARGSGLKEAQKEPYKNLPSFSKKAISAVIFLLGRVTPARGQLP